MLNKDSSACCAVDNASHKIDKRLYVSLFIRLCCLVMRPMNNFA